MLLFFFSSFVSSTWIEYSDLKWKSLVDNSFNLPIFALCFSPYCPHCVGLPEGFKRYSDGLGNRTDLLIVTINCMKQYGCAHFHIRGTPTIALVVGNEWQYWPRSPERGPEGWDRWVNQSLAPNLRKIETDEEIYGIGEGFALGCLDSIAAYTMECLAPLLIGSNPLEITRLWNRIYQQTVRFGKRGLGIAALSAVDIALWDILGKKAGLPVCSLLGKAHDCIYPYASAGYYAPGKTIEDLRKEAAGYKARGFQMMKMKMKLIHQE